MRSFQQGGLIRRFCKSYFSVSFVVLAGVFFSWFLFLPAHAGDPPHNAASGVTCSDCHGQTLLSGQSPFWSDNRADTAYNSICLSRCHTPDGAYPFANTNAPPAKTHTLGSTAIKCTVCHHNHDQQMIFSGKNSQNTFFLATGAVDTGAPDPVFYNSGTGLTTITYASLAATDAGSEWAADLSSLCRKTGDGRGAMLVPNRSSRKRWPLFLITDLNTTDKKITVKGQVTAASNLGIFYGQVIRTQINYESSPGVPANMPRNISFYGKEGARSFAVDEQGVGTGADPTADGICQVCHTQTDHWSPAAQAGDEHYSGQDCTECHSHMKGFVHRSDGTGSVCGDTAGCHDSNKHANHLGSGIFCSDCHELDNMRDGNGDVIDPIGEGVCSTCHQSGTGGAANLTGFVGGWTVPGYDMNCAGCHDGRPNADYDAALLVHGDHDNVTLPTEPEEITLKTVGSKPCVDCHAAGHSGRVNCTDCHKGHVEACHVDDTPADHVDGCDPDVTLTKACDGCHDGTGGKTGMPKAPDFKPDWQRKPVGIKTLGHERLVSTRWIRQYACYYCHAASVDESWNLSPSHNNSTPDVIMAEKWEIVSQAAPFYNPSNKICYNTYCHSDGTYVTPEMRPYNWDGGHRDCNACHGHNPADNECSNCHADGRTWNADEKWLSAMPMYTNTGPGTDRANTHFRHMFTGFSCDDCHAATVVGACLDCHDAGIPTGNMSEDEHINPLVHVDKDKTVAFKDGGSYDPASKTCSSTVCHIGADPAWGGSVSETITCLECHGTTEADVDDFGEFNNIRARINLTQWATTGHGRPAVDGNYSVASNNPAANLPGNGCWYCHDNQVLHKTPENPFRLRQHEQFANRFEKECVYCHMLGEDTECLNCHDNTSSLAIQLSTIDAITTGDPIAPYPILRPDHTVRPILGALTCSDGPSCHVNDAARHKTGDETVWTQADKDDVRNSYMMMGVCLKCHDDDTGGQCNSCHTAPVDDPGTPDIDESLKYDTGFDPGLTGTSYIKPQKAKASSFHFGYKHYVGYETDGKWRGGKFCWDCHDPHGDDNIYMIQNEVATETDGIYGKPLSRAEVEFTSKISGLDYAWEDVDANGDVKGICNVCHSAGSQHYTAAGGDGHNSGRICTDCHEHRFTDSHASGRSCNECHENKPVPRHSGMGLPRDCTKCHKGVVGQRMDVMGQFAANSHHVQGVEMTNKHCYACHWEATEDGLIDTTYHEGYDYRDHSSVPNAKVDLVIWNEFEEPDIEQFGNSNKTVGGRPIVYDPDGTNPAGPGKPTVTTFTASQLKVSNVAQRAEVSNVTDHCLGCHSNDNNDSEPFEDCKTPRQYAWDRTSVAARYDTDETTDWGKSDSTKYPNAAGKDKVTKAFSAHGRAVLNEGGFSETDGEDKDITNTRPGIYNVQCFDCHSSHGSKAIGTTSSYVTFNGTKNGGNLKETQGGVGGYKYDYTATENENMASINPYKTGAGQCFDCHENAMAETLVGPGSYTPWGYTETFEATKPIIGFRDSAAFGQSERGLTNLFPYMNETIVGGHFKRSSDLSVTPMGTIDGLCTPCHDPHGISPTLGDKKQYAVPLLKGTWITSPYKMDAAADEGDGTGGNDYYTIYQNNTVPISSGKPRPPQNRTDGRDPGAWRTDRNTFNQADLAQLEGHPTQYDRITENPDQFAGLCLRCHPKDSLTSEVSAEDTEALSWATKERIHRTVKGWGWNEGDTEREHSFTCSKCHSAHVSGLPRLMKTNCLAYKHRGKQASGGLPGSWNGNKLGRFPFGWWAKGEYQEGTTALCHGTDSANGPAGLSWPDNQTWNNIINW